MAARIPDAPRPDDSGGAENAPFHNSHFDQLREQGIIKSDTSSIAGTLDAPKTNDTDGAETNLFDDSHFDQLREQGIIKSESFISQDVVPKSDQHRDATQQTMSIHSWS